MSGDTTLLTAASTGAGSGVGDATSQFLAPGFDAASYVRSLLSDPSLSGDLSHSISRLSLSISSIEGSVQSLVTLHASALLERLASLSRMRGCVGDVQAGLSGLEVSLSGLETRVAGPSAVLRHAQGKLERLDDAADLVSQAVRFVTVARRLEAQMEAGDLATAALVLHELAALTPVLGGLHMVRAYLPTIEAARHTVTTHMEDMVVRGLRDLDPVRLASSLQMAHNLGSMDQLVHELVDDLTQVVRERTAAAFPDWSKVQTLLGTEIPAVAAKVYCLDKVLRVREDRERIRDRGSDPEPDPEPEPVPEPVQAFWSAVAQALGAHAGRLEHRQYPRLVRLLQDLFAQLQPPPAPSDPAHEGVMRALSPMAERYLASLFERPGAAAAHIVDAALDATRFDARLHAACCHRVLEYLRPRSTETVVAILPRLPPPLAAQVHAAILAPRTTHP